MKLAILLASVATAFVAPQKGTGTPASALRPRVTRDVRVNFFDQFFPDADADAELDGMVSSAKAASRVCHGSI